MAIERKRPANEVNVRKKTIIKGAKMAPSMKKPTQSKECQNSPRTGAAHSLPGRLIAFEGLEGSGISTQMRLMYQWLLSMNSLVFISIWESSDLVVEASKRGRKQQLFTPMTYSLLHATDFADRYDRQILPMLKAGFIVLCDRYYFTSMARDYTRGCDPKWVKEIYSFACPPDITFYLDLPLHVAIERKLESRQPIDFFEAGMDLGLSQDIQESYRIFQGRISEQYAQMIEPFGFDIINAVDDIHLQQSVMRSRLQEHIHLADFIERKLR